MNNEFLLQLSPEDQTISDVLQSSAQSIQVNPHFQSSLEARLKGAHPGNNQPEKRGLHIKIIPAIGWAILAIGAFLILNWALRALVPNHQPAAGKTAIPTVATEQAAIPNVVSAATPVPTSAEYDWRGTKLYLNADIARYSRAGKRLPGPTRTTSHSGFSARIGRTIRNEREYIRDALRNRQQRHAQLPGRRWEPAFASPLEPVLFVLSRLRPLDSQQHIRTNPGSSHCRGNDWRFPKLPRIRLCLQSGTL